MIIKPNASPSVLPSVSSSSSDEKEQGQFSTLLNDRLNTGQDKKIPLHPADNLSKHAGLRKEGDETGDPTLKDLTGLKGLAVVGTDILNLHGLTLPSPEPEEGKQAAEEAIELASPLPPGGQAVPLPVAAVAAAVQNGTRAASSPSATAMSTQGAVQNGIPGATEIALSTTELQTGSLQKMASRAGAVPSLPVAQKAPPLGIAPPLTEAEYSPILLSEQGVAGVQVNGEGVDTLMASISHTTTEAPSGEQAGATESDLSLSVQNADINAAGKSTLPAAVDVTAGIISQPVGTPAWQHALSQQLSYFTRNGIHNAELRLHPEELGALQINLQLNNDRAQLHFVTANHQVRAAIEAAMPHLRTSLEESGISLGQSSVGEDASSSWHAPSDSDTGARSALQSDNEESENVLSEEPATVQRVRLYDGINTFV